MKKIKIGIARSLLYHRYGVMWKAFFTNLDCKVILSPETNKEILNIGSNNSNSTSCLPYKINIGHLYYLKDICDYILIANICNYGKNNMVCPILNSTYNNIISKDKLLTYTIEHTKFKFEFLEFIKLGLKINKNIFKVIHAYFLAKKKQNNYNIIKENEIKNKLSKKQVKTLIVSQNYIMFDKYVCGNIIDYLEKQNINIVYANNLNKSLAISFADYFSETLSLQYSKELMGAIYYYRHQINGIIFISSNHCYQDALVNNLAIIKNKFLPTLHIIIDKDSTEDIDKKLKKYIKKIKGECYDE